MGFIRLLWMFAVVFEFSVGPINSPISLRFVLLRDVCNSEAFIAVLG